MLPRDEKNKKLTAAPANQPMAAVTALASVKHKGVARQVLSKSSATRLPDASVTKHFQGIAVTGTRLFATTSSRKGRIISADLTAPTEYTITAPLAGFGQPVHPGGIQLIGHYLVIPVYGSTYSGIEFRDIDNGLGLVKEFRTTRKPYAVGIATSRDGDGEFYVLAAITQDDGTRVDVYRSPSERRLIDPQCYFELRWSYKTTRARNRRSRSKWNGYPNSISLLADSKGNVYFLGLYKTAFYGDDFADLYHLDLTKPDDQLFKRLKHVRFTCTGAPAFRWGASASVTGRKAIELYACEKDAQRNKKMRMDVFSA